MHARDLFARSKPTFSFEFFPPKSDEAAETLFETIRELEALHPDFVSVTYGAGGGTRERTHQLVTRLRRETSLEAVPHLTCVCHDRAELGEIIQRYADAGVSNILALGGDVPRDRPDHDRSRDAFQHAAELVGFIRGFAGRHPDPRGFGVGVAGFPEGHPATPNRLRELEFLKAKVDAGADYICTQLFFDNAEFYDFVERCRLTGIQVPIIAGIMPVATRAGLERMAELSGGTRFPARLLRLLERAGNDAAAFARAGLHFATEQCADLLDHGIDGIHFYTLNQSQATRQIYQTLGLARV